MNRVQRTIAELGFTRDVPQMSPDDKVTRALDAMCRDGHGSILVVENNDLVGIFTSRDFLSRVAASRRDPAEVTLREVMTGRPEVLEPDDGLVYAINRMTAGGYRNVPIEDASGKILGIMTIWDVVRHLDDIFDDLRTPVGAGEDSEISGVTWIDTGGG
jgi:CBS domain-containing protein